MPRRAAVVLALIATAAALACLACYRNPPPCPAGAEWPDPCAISGRHALDAGHD